MVIVLSSTENYNTEKADEDHDANDDTTNEKDMTVFLANAFNNFEQVFLEVQGQGF